MALTEGVAIRPPEEKPSCAAVALAPAAPLPVLLATQIAVAHEIAAESVLEALLYGLPLVSQAA